MKITFWNVYYLHCKLRHENCNNGLCDFSISYKFTFILDGKILLLSNIINYIIMTMTVLYQTENNCNEQLVLEMIQ